MRDEDAALLEKWTNIENSSLDEEQCYYYKCNHLNLHFNSATIYLCVIFVLHIYIYL